MNPLTGELSMIPSNTKWLINLKKWITVVSYLEKIESAVIDIDVDLSSLDEEELYETLWDFEFEIDEDKITPEKSLYWLTGGHTEWKQLEHYEKTWYDCYLIFQEEFGISIMNIIKKSKKLKDIREEFKRCLNLPIIYDFALSQNLIK